MKSLLGLFRRSPKQNSEVVEIDTQEQTQFAWTFLFPEHYVILSCIHHCAATYNPKGLELRPAASATTTQLGIAIDTVLKHSLFVPVGTVGYDYIMGRDGDRFEEWRKRQVEALGLPSLGAFAKRIPECMIERHGPNITFYPTKYVRSTRQVRHEPLVGKADAAPKDVGALFCEALRLSAGK